MTDNIVQASFAVEQAIETTIRAYEGLVVDTQRRRPLQPAQRAYARKLAADAVAKVRELARLVEADTAELDGMLDGYQANWMEIAECAGAA